MPTIGHLKYKTERSLKKNELSKRFYLHDNNEENEIF
jgi:hypothetical protein